MNEDLAARKAHWEDVYETRPSDDVSWFQARPATSLALIDACTDRAGAVIDVGGGDATLVDHLLATGYTDVTVLDISAAALTRAQDRLGAVASRADWVASDVLTFTPPRRYAVWHDRAVFHFLTRPDERAAYVRVLDAALAPDGHIILMTFALDGPETCSGLPVARYDAATLAAALGESFRLVGSHHETHVTPWDTKQAFLVATFTRTTHADATS